MWATGRGVVLRLGVAGVVFHILLQVMRTEFHNNYRRPAISMSKIVAVAFIFSQSATGI